MTAPTATAVRPDAPPAPQPDTFACSRCGCRVDADEQTRAIHNAWHRDTERLRRYVAQLREQVHQLSLQET